MASLSRLVVATALLNPALALLVTSGSDCDDQCGNVLDATTPADIVCDQDDYGSSAGVVFENCLNCELTSTHYTSNPNATDLQWMLYNSRYALSECMFGEPGNVSVDGDLYGTCITSRACGQLQNAFQYGNLSTNTSIGPYDYCTDWTDDTFVDGCEFCLRAAGQTYLANMVVLLQVACDQKPQPGGTLSVAGSIFSTTIMNETAPTPTATWTSTYSGPLSLGAKVGVAVGGLCLVLAVAGFCIVCNGRRRRRAFLRRLEMRHRESGWPHPGGGGGGVGGLVVHRGPDLTETPLSQKPLRGWDDSPQSATASEPSYARYFSPYSSQHGSPVHGADAAAMRWPSSFHDEPPAQALQQQQQQHYGDFGFPTSAQEKAAQGWHHEAAAAGGGEGEATPPMHIGLALGGDEPSLRSKVSDQSALRPGDSGNGPAHAAEEIVEEYELHDVSGSSAGGSSAGGIGHAPGPAGSRNSFRNRIARENRAPVLQHPGYGRNSPEKAHLPPPPPPIHTMSGGLMDGPDGENRM